MQILLAFSPHKIGFLSTRGRFPILPPMGGGLRLGPRKRILPVFWPGGLASATTRWPTSKRKESGHGKTHGRQGQRPHRISARLREISHRNRERPRETRLDGLARDPEPQDRQRKALRMLQPALQSLRRVRPAAFRRVLEQNPKELRALLRALPAILRGRLRTLGQDPVRLQRMRSEPHCPLRKKYYRAAGAQANYAGVLHASRLGVRVDDETFGKMDAVVSLGVKKGQSVRHIVASNPEL